MDDILFCKSFSFKLISHRRLAHTDNSRGTDVNFIARMVCGSGRIVTLDGEALCVSAGDVFYLPKGLCYHSYWTPSEEDGRVEWESYGFAFYPDADGQRYRMQMLALTDESRAMLDELAARMTVTPSSVGVLYSFFGKAMRGMSTYEDDGKRVMLRRAERYIYEHPDMRVPLLARHCGMSESGLYAFFKAYAGETPVEMKNRILVKKASELLGTTDLSVEQIGERLGFSSVVHFRRIVRRATGKTPTQIRKELLNSYSL